MKRHIFIGLFLFTSLSLFSHPDTISGYRTDIVYDGISRIKYHHPHPHSSSHNAHSEIQKCSSISAKNYGIIFFGMGALAALIRIID